MRVRDVTLHVGDQFVVVLAPNDGSVSLALERLGAIAQATGSGLYFM